jgi:hypothetical protein
MKTSADEKLVTSKLLWLMQAPNFNFELNEEDLLAKALASGFVTKVEEEVYKINENYGED